MGNVNEYLGHFILIGSEGVLGALHPDWRWGTSAEGERLRFDLGSIRSPGPAASFPRSRCKAGAPQRAGWD
eukprot:gene16445-biopygen9318